MADDEVLRTVVLVAVGCVDVVAAPALLRVSTPGMPDGFTMVPPDVVWDLVVVDDRLVI